MTEFQQRIQAEAEAMAEMHRAGKKNREIADAFGCDPSIVTMRLKRVGIKASGRMRRLSLDAHSSTSENDSVSRSAMSSRQRVM